MIRTLLILILFLSAHGQVFADSIQLVTGKVIEGEIVKHTEIYVRIKPYGQESFKEYLVEQVAGIVKGGKETILQEVEPQKPIVVPKETETQEQEVEPEEEYISKPESETGSVNVEAEERQSEEAIRAEAEDNVQPTVVEEIKIEKQIEADEVAEDLANEAQEELKQKQEPQKIKPVRTFIGRQELYPDFGSGLKEEDEDAASETQSGDGTQEKKEVELLTLTGDTEEKAAEEIDVRWYQKTIIGGLKITHGIVLLVILAVVGFFLKDATPVEKLPGESKTKPELSKKPPLPDDLKKAPNKEATINESNYWQHIWEIFVYPVKGTNKLALAGGSVFFTIISFAMLMPFYGLIVSILFLSYMIGCMVSIVQTTVSSEREDHFEWPDFISIFDWFGTAVLFVLAAIISYAPVFFYFRFAQQLDPVFFLLIAVAIFINPMYTLSISLVGGLSSLNIINVFKAIGHTFVPYTLTVLFLFFIQGLAVLAQLIPLTAIPFLGNFVKWFISVYFLFVNMRLLGSFYKAHRMRLNWYGESD